MFGDVLERTLYPRNGAIGVAFRLGAHAHPLSRAFGGENFRFEVEWRAVGRTGLDGGCDLVPPWVGIERQRVGEWRHMPVSVVEDVKQFVGPEYVFPGHLDRPAARVRQAACYADQRVLLPRFVLGLLACSDVGRNADDPDQVSPSVHDG